MQNVQIIKKNKNKKKANQQFRSVTWNHQTAFRSSTTTTTTTFFYPLDDRTQHTFVLLLPTQLMNV